MKRKIVVFTSTRADYGILTPVIKAIEEHQNLEMHLIATGMHTLKKFGYTLDSIDKSFKNIHQFEMSVHKDTKKAAALGMAECVSKTSEILDEINPDFFLCLGDRYETLVAAAASAIMNISIAHIHGGDKTKSGLDESFRHALTKMANIHFPATEKSAERIRKLGENPDYIFTVGSPSLDTILNQKLMPKEEIFDKYSIERDKPLALVVQHPVTSQVEQSRSQIRETLDAIKDNLESIVIYPSNDPGHQAIIDEIEKFRMYSNFHIHPSLPHLDYLSILKNADIMIGNSSSGMIDASAFNTPVINIGIRQEGRERGSNVIDSSHNKNHIQVAISLALYNESFRSKLKYATSPYGDGTAGKKIADILSKIEVNENMLQKQITY